MTTGLYSSQSVVSYQNSNINQYLILFLFALALDLSPELGDLHLLALDLLHLLALFILARLKPSPLADLFPATLVMVMMTIYFSL